ncbi:unnamed protein product [Closterium sp. NIES-53]
MIGRHLGFDESVSYYARYPHRGLPVPSPPLFLASTPPPSLDPLVKSPHPSPGPLGVSHATPLPSVARHVSSPSPLSPSQSPQQPLSLPRQVAVESGGVDAGDTCTGGAESEEARAGGAGTRVGNSGGAGVVGAGTRGASSEEVGARDTTTAAPNPLPHRYPTRHQALGRLEREE